MTLITDPSLQHRYSLARHARDARFDGEFYVAVKTTGIYCRPICPANTPLEKNIAYYHSAVAAAHDGFRPCLRCRPDSAPQSCAWQGTDTTFKRALSLIQQGELQHGSLPQLAERLGISDRYLRELFQSKLGTSPKKYALYQQCLFAKKLLHESALSITDVGFAAGFNSIRRFNEAMKQQLGLSPSDIRKVTREAGHGIELSLCYRPPFAWEAMLEFLQHRAITSLEWVDDTRYGRTIEFEGRAGYFEVSKVPNQHRFELRLHLDDYALLNPIVQKLRQLFDLDAPISLIDQQLQPLFGDSNDYLLGLRIPGIWSSFEAGVRAVLGQQVSVSAARGLVSQLVDELGQAVNYTGVTAHRLFPSPEAVRDSDLAFLKMPGARKATLKRLAEHILTTREPNAVDQWIDLKGIGPWTLNYVKLRGRHDPDVWLEGDAGIRNALAAMSISVDTESARPWRSYLTFQLWQQLSSKQSNKSGSSGHDD